MRCSLAIYICHLIARPLLQQKEASKAREKETYIKNISCVYSFAWSLVSVNIDGERARRKVIINRESNFSLGGLAVHQFPMPYSKQKTDCHYMAWPAPPIFDIHIKHRSPTVLYIKGCCNSSILKTTNKMDRVDRHTPVGQLYMRHFD